MKLLYREFAGTNLLLKHVGRIKKDKPHSDSSRQLAQDDRW
jgi:hypothetical protein